MPLSLPRHFCINAIEIRLEWRAQSAEHQVPPAGESMHAGLSTGIRTLRLKVKGDAYAWLNAAAIEVNQVWNWANSVSDKAARPFAGAPRWLTAYDLDKLSAGATACFDHIGSETIQRINAEFATRRRQFRKTKLRWRVSRGSRRSRRSSSIAGSSRGSPRPSAAATAVLRPAVKYVSEILKSEGVYPAAIARRCDFWRTKTFLAMRSLRFARQGMWYSLDHGSRVARHEERGSRPGQSTPTPLHGACLPRRDAGRLKVAIETVQGVGRGH